MKYVSTIEVDGVETVITVLPIEDLPEFNPLYPPPNTYVVSEDVKKGWVRSNNIFVSPSTLPLKLSDFQRAHDAFLNAPARARRYDSIITASLRAGYPGPYHDEGVAFATWMDTCNEFGYQVMAEIESGTRPMFKSVAEYITLLPAFEMPT